MGGFAMANAWRIIAILLINVLFGTQIQAAEPLLVFAGLPPAAFLAQRIGGGYVHVESLIQSNQDPHTFEPAPRQIQALAQAQLFLKIGMPFEDQLLEKIRDAHCNLTVVDISRGIEKRAMSNVYSCRNDAHEHKHLHGNTCVALDPHVWLSPPLVKILASNVAAALEKADPKHAQAFRTNLARLQRELDELDAKIHAMLKPYSGRAFYVYHPAFGYFADRYQLKQEAIEAGGKEPLPSQFRRLIQHARAERVKVIFLQAQFDAHNAQAVADAIGARVVSLNDMDHDLLANLRDIAEKIARAFKERDKAE
ncbi:MAG: metal ABC transporter solute-binding protein, Zn/Mn family [Thermoguttaceae bacterium]